MTIEAFKRRLPTLARYGVAAERFPAFVNLTSAPHELEVVLLTVVLEGRGVHVIDGVEFEIPGPSFAFTYPGESHVLLTGQSGFDVVNVYLDVDSRGMTLGAPLDVALAALIPWAEGPPLRRLPQVGLSNVARMRAVLELLVSESEDFGTGSADAFESLLKLLLVECARSMAERGHLPDGDRAGHPAIEKVRALLDRTYLEQHKLDDLAAAAHLERTYFSRLFAETTGETVTDYLASRRIRYAMTRLRGSDSRVAEIAAASGFRDLSHFGRIFRRYAGVSPREYRRTHTQAG